ncbi:MAG: LysM domain-containing protein [Chloroflexota bacterium]
MTERGLPSMDGAPACPFVAFGDDRDGRATSPDHRHRCFAESPPAPRALAHQEAYCLSSAFPVCPVFQDWARREAAHARGAGDRAETAPTAVPADMADSAPDADRESVREPEPSPRDPADPPVRRNPPRDWAAPPPWAGGAIGAAAAGAVVAGAGRAGAIPGEPAGSDFLAGRSGEGQGLAGSAADRLAGPPPPPSPSSAGAAGVAASAAAWSASGAGAASTAPDDDLAGLVVPRSSVQPPARTAAEAYPPPTMTGRRPTVSSTRPSGDVVAGPAWEGMRRNEAYPTIKSRRGIPGSPRIAVLVGALVIAALVLFMLPALLGVGGGGGPGAASPSASRPAVTTTPSITPLPAPSAQVYVIQQKDTLSKVAKRFGLTLAELLAANPDIKNADRVSIGQQIIIPLPATGPAPSVSAAP